MNSTELREVTEVPRLPARPRDANKGTFGRVLVVAGARGMSGAAVLCGSAALRGGAGLVFVAVPESVWPVVASANPCYLTVPLPDSGEERLAVLAEQGRNASAVVVGPGLGQGDSAREAVIQLLATTTVPLVLDADALNLCARHQPFPARAGGGPTVITPHPGEFARLVRSEIPHVQAHRQELAVQFARENGLTVVLKGAGTLVTDGQRVYTNTTGNPGMATGGTGDVLAGLIGALLAQGLSTFDAAVLGTYLHGLAGDRAANTLGEVSLIASDLLDWLPEAFLEHQRGDGAD